MNDEFVQFTSHKTLETKRQWYSVLSYDCKYYQQYGYERDSVKIYYQNKINLSNLCSFILNGTLSGLPSEIFFNV